jgi:hypothetical protein
MSKVDFYPAFTMKAEVAGVWNVGVPPLLGYRVSLLRRIPKYSLCLHIEVVV